ncbi:MAG: hypothetical protein ABI691_21860 [Ginsengibacter sp.]
MAKLQEHDIQYAGNGINRFFDVYRLPAAIGYMERLLEAATLPKVWRHDVPANALCFMENMEQLLAAAYTLHNSHNVNDEAITATGVTGVTDITAGAAPNGHQNNAWEYFPRSLTLRQFGNPLMAINQCCSYMPGAEWKQLLRDITECALGNTTLYELLPDCNILRVRRYLLRLVEGCYIIGLCSQAKNEIKKRPEKKKAGIKK